MFETLYTQFKSILLGEIGGDGVGDEVASEIEEVENIIQNTLPSHPYYPTNLELPNYTEPTLSMTTILAAFISVLSLLIFTSLIIISSSKNYSNKVQNHAKSSNKHKVSTKNKIIFTWFVICGFIHTFFEGYFAAFYQTIQQDNALFAQMWKEYALSDSRYLTSDPFVVNMERITSTLWGPLSFTTALAIYQNWPSRYVLQLVISLGQLYGCILYYWTTIFEGSPHSRPETYYYWVYFVFANAFWMVIPSILIFYSWVRLTSAVREDMKRKSKKAD
ncbi:10847_t:CDS:2 [Ambispora gerdemannii]|uniref:10847_t:CDS:1 n=1 Tax=Ambispora gerdemannii TaxID=144530 RepID=A0A9N8VV90_9GLOM|nr:10847_t:CDS:2 [Ambispora gerdemannii]